MKRIALLLILAAGCGTAEDRLRDDVRLARDVLRHARFAGETEKNRIIFLQKADEDDPPTSAGGISGIGAAK